MPLLRRLIYTLAMLSFMSTTCLATVSQPYDQATAVNPLRLSYINGSVSFWRYGAEDWVEARINTPLTVGDALYSGKNAEFELQAESRSFIRADDNSQITLINQTPDYLQLKVTSGRVSLDLRTLPSAGYNIEVDTPNAVFTIDRAGYYRLDVNGDVHFITRRGGQATLIPAGGEAMSIRPSEEIVVQGTDVARAETYAAPDLDDWDRWNYDRTTGLIDSVSERYFPTGIAGARDLDYYGSWRVTDEYGAVWVPAMPPDWVPYSTGRWMWDPYYQWTWVDDAPWGWAPFHYGRWIYLGGYWSWCPGPVIHNRPIYSPALVAFFGVSSNVSVSVSIGGSGMGWVALGWGEPIVPWWGRSGFIGRPWWGGWSGPRVVNNVVVRQNTTINVTNITYANSRVSNAIIATPVDRFGRGNVREGSDRIRLQERELEHIHGALPIKPNTASLMADVPKGVRPPEEVISRRVLSTRRTQEIKLPWRPEAAGPIGAEQHVITAPKPDASTLRRPEFGTQAGPERARPPLPPHYEDWKRQTLPPTTPPAGSLGPREINRAESKPSSNVPSEPATSIQRPRESNLPTAAPGRITPPMPKQQIPHIEVAPSPASASPPAVVTPPPGMRDRASPTPAPARITPPERPQQMPRMEAAPKLPERSTNLPGIPANRTYRGGNQGKPEK